MGRRMSNTRSALVSGCLSVGHSLQPDLSESSTTSPSHLHKQRRCHSPDSQCLRDLSSPSIASTDTEQGPG